MESESMDSSFRPITMADAQILIGWQYAEPYRLYNFASDGPAEALQFFADPANAYHAAIDAGGELVAYRCFGADAQVRGGNYPDDALDTGGGMRPDLTGQGLGLPMLQAGLALGRQLYAPRAFRVTVAAFNQRALAVVGRAGFQPAQRFTRAVDGREFVVLVREPA